MPSSLAKSSTVVLRKAFTQTNETTGPLHDNTAATRLLGSVRVLALGNGAPDRWHHVVPCPVAVGNNAKDNSRQQIPYLMAILNNMPAKGPVLLTSWKLCSRGFAPDRGPHAGGCSAPSIGAA